MSPLAYIWSYCEIMSAFHFHYWLCLTPKYKVELKHRPLPPPPSIDALTTIAIPCSFKPCALKHKKLRIAVQPGAIGVDIMQHTSCKREAVVRQWFYTGLILHSYFSNDREFSQQNNGYQLLY